MVGLTGQGRGARHQAIGPVGIDGGSAPGEVGEGVSMFGVGCGDSAGWVAGGADGVVGVAGWPGWSSGTDQSPWGMEGKPLASELVAFARPLPSPSSLL